MSKQLPVSPHKGMSVSQTLCRKKFLHAGESTPTLRIPEAPGHHLIYIYIWVGQHLEGTVQGLQLSRSPTPCLCSKAELTLWRHAPGYHCTGLLLGLQLPNILHECLTARQQAHLPIRHKGQLVAEAVHRKAAT